MYDTSLSRNKHMSLEFVAQPMFDRGTNSPCVARTVLQTQGLIQAFPLSDTSRQQVLEVAYNVMRRLIAIEAIRERIVGQVAEGKARILREGLDTQSAGRFATLPVVINIEQEVESFLHNAKLALRDIAGLFEPLYGSPAFDHKYQKIRKWAEATLGSEDPFVQVLESDGGWIDRIINMRNAIEHPTDPHAPLSVRNFQVLNKTPPWEVAEPTWFLKGEHPTAIAADLDAIADNLLTLFEDILTDGLLRLGPAGPFTIVEIPAANREPKCPMRLSVALTHPLPSQTMPSYTSEPE